MKVESPVANHQSVGQSPGRNHNDSLTDVDEERAAGSANGSPSFVLAPTPAQLGRAPLQRRQSQGMTTEII